jgi:hypothetical protein
MKIDNTTPIDELLILANNIVYSAQDDRDRDAARAELQRRSDLAAAPIHVWRFGDAPKHLRDLSTNGGDEDWLAEVAPEVAGMSSLWMTSGSAFGFCDVDEYPHPTRPGWVVRIGSHG